MQAVGIPPSLHGATGELVDDDDLVVLDDVVGVAPEQPVRPQRLVGVVHQGDVLDVIETAVLENAGLGEQPLDLLGALVGQGDGALLLVLLVVLRLEHRDQGVDLHVQRRAVVGGTRDDQRGARLVDQDRVDLVDDRVVEFPLDHVLQPELHVVAQIVEAELVVGTVGHVAGIRPPPLVVVEAMHDAADGQAEVPVDAAHPLGIAACQVVVHGDDVHALTGQGVQVNRQGRDQGLALAGLHFGDLALVQHHAAEQLDVEMALPQHAPGGLANHRERLGLQGVDLLAGGEASLERLGLGPQIIVGECRNRRLERVDRRDRFLQTLENTIVLGPEQGLGDGAEHEVPRIVRRPAAVETRHLGGRRCPVNATGRRPKSSEGADLLRFHFPRGILGPGDAAIGRKPDHGRQYHRGSADRRYRRSGAGSNAVIDPHA